MGECRRKERDKGRETAEGWDGRGEGQESRREPRAGGRGGRAQRSILSRDQINGAPVGERGQPQGEGVSQLAGAERRGAQAGKSTGEEETQGEQDGRREREGAVTGI